MEDKKINFIITLFLGGFGVHKFIKGDVKIGILYLFTGGLFGIGWFVDIIKSLLVLFNNNDKKINTNEDLLKDLSKDNYDKTGNYSSEIKTNTKHIFFYNKLSLKDVVNKRPDEYIVIDTETTGLYPEGGDRIIEFALLKYKDGILVDKMISLVNPQCLLPQKIVDITGIKDSDLVNKQPITKYINQIIKFINNKIIIGHNVLFDIRFLYSEINRCDFETDALSIEYIDTLDIARETVYDIENYKLETLKNYFKINTTSHRAESDCETTNEVYKRCLKLLIDKNIREQEKIEYYKKREKERLDKISNDEKDIINYFTQVAKEHNKEIECHVMSDRSIQFSLCNIEIGRIKFNGKKRFCKLFAGDFKEHKWTNVDNPEKKQILEYIEDLFKYIDKEYENYFLAYKD